MGKSLKRIQFSKDERNFWKNLEINIDSFSDRWEDLYREDYLKKLESLPNSFAKKVVDYFKINVPLNGTNKASLISDRRHSILTYCIISFALKNPKVLSEIFKIPVTHKEVNKSRVITTVLEQFIKNRLTDLYLFLLKQKAGKGRYLYHFTEQINDSQFDEIINFIPKLATFLRRREKNNKMYHFRFGYKGKTGEWIFLLLKETNDKVYNAIPNNISMVSGIHKLVTIHPTQKTIQIHTQSKDEALIIRNYFNERLNNSYTFTRNEKKYVPSDFFEKVLSDSVNSLRLIDVRFKDSNIGVKIHLTDREKKHDIISQLKILKNNETLKLADFSEFEDLTFYFEGINIKVEIHETMWGLHKLNLVDKGIPHSVIDSFSQQFKSKLGVPLDTWLKRSDEALNENFIISKILDRKTVPVYTISKDIETTLLQLMSEKIIGKFQYDAKRICEKCYTKTWEKGSCPKCGNNMRIDGDFVEIKTNVNGINEFVYKTLASLSELKVSKDKVQISRTKHLFIDVMNKQGTVMSIYISQNNVPQEIVDYFHNNGLPLLIVLTRYKDAIAKSLNENNFECISLVDLYLASKHTRKFAEIIQEKLESQKMKWKQKLVDKGNFSYRNITNKTDKYSPQNFETDIFNLFHEIFYVAFKLGGSFTGVAAPDGILSIQNYKKPISKFCMSWDCKYSNHKDGYQLNEPVKKHKHYINILKNNSKVKFYGSLKIHAIISQNMNSTKYSKFYKTLVYRNQWKGNVIFIHENIVLDIYKFYKNNEEKINLKPDIFYSSIYNMFLKIYKIDLSPYPLLSEKRLEKMIDDVTKKYEKNNIKLSFVRSDFNK